MTAQQPWQWDESTWRGHVEHVRAGRLLRPGSWPGNAKVAVALSFDSDHGTPALRDGEVLPGKLSQGEYGARVGVPRILRLERFGAPSTFFVPAVSAPPTPSNASPGRARSASAPRLGTSRPHPAHHPRARPGL